MADKTLERFLEEFPPEMRNAIGKQAFESWLAGNRDSTKTEMAELRKRKMLMDLQEKEETVGLRKESWPPRPQSPSTTPSCLAVAGPNPSAVAKAAMKTRTRQIREGIREDTAEPRGSINPHDRHNNRLFCPECGVLFLLNDTKGVRLRHQGAVHRPHLQKARADPHRVRGGGPTETMNRVYVITHRKDSHILGICRNERAVQRRPRIP